MDKKQKLKLNAWYTAVYLQNWVVLGTWQQMYHFAFEYLRMFFFMFLGKQMTSSFEM